MMPNYDYSKDLTSDNKNGLVYVIDDDADVRESIKWLLESTNYRVEDYESGETFIAQFNESVPSVILCDLRMPGMSGADVQDHLMRRRIDAPFIFITGHGDVPQAVQAFKKGAMDFIQKGFLGDVYYSKAQYVRRHGNPGGWFADKARSGGGPIIDLGVHVIDLTRYLMGSPKPVSVYAAASDRLGNRPYLHNGEGWKPEDASETDVCTVEDFATALIRYDNGAVTYLETSYDLNGEDIAKRQLFGTKGGMDLSKGVKIYGEYNNFLADIDVKTENYKESQDMFVAEMAHFVDCVKNGTPCRAKAEDGIVVMKILDAIYESARTGHEVIL